jgi:hypothetical protein
MHSLGYIVRSPDLPSPYDDLAYPPHTQKGDSCPIEA